MNQEHPVTHENRPAQRNPWFWIPTLYYAEGIPYVIVMLVSVIMYKRLGISNTEIALYTSWLYLPWVIKPLWSPLVDVLRTKRFWIVAMQLVIGAGLAGVALTIPAPSFFQYTLAFFWLLAFSSATHDIAADGFYMLGLTKHKQAWFVGVRSTFYRLAMITGQGALIILTGFIESSTGPVPAKFDFQVQANAQTQLIVQPDSIQFQAQDGPLRIVYLPENVRINTEKIPAAIQDSLKNMVKTWNQQHGFVPADIPQTQQELKQRETWWTRVVSTHLAVFLREHFGEEQRAVRADNLRGNVAVVAFHLSKPPETGAEVVINFSRESGDKSIEIVEGSRFTITRINWDKPCLALLQIDPKLQTATSAEFIARGGNVRLAWVVTFAVLTVLFVVFFVYHKFILPYPKNDKAEGRDDAVLKQFFLTFVAFFRKKHILAILAFLLFYRFAEAQLVKLAAPFLLDVQDAGGLALTTGELGFVYGTVGIIALTLGGLLGGFLAAKHGLKFWLWWMVLAINLPNVVYIFLSYFTPESFFIINLSVAVEQFGYGFGFTAYMLYMIYAAEGEHKTAHFAICTGFMALGMMIPGMFSGWLQEIIGYKHFFIWIVIATIPSFIATKLIPLDGDFGKKRSDLDES